MAAKEMISLRVWRDDLERWKQAARGEGVTKSAWINKTLNEATSGISPGGGAASVAEEAESLSDGA